MRVDVHHYMQPERLGPTKVFAFLWKPERRFMLMTMLAVHPWTYANNFSTKWSRIAEIPGTATLATATNPTNMASLAPSQILERMMEGKMMEIIYFLGQAVGESPVLKGDYMLDTKKRVYCRSCYAPVIRKGDYGVFRKCIEQGTNFTPSDNSRILDFLTIVVNGGYAFFV